MKFSEAMAALEDGKKVRRKHWGDKGSYLHRVKDQIRWGGGGLALMADYAISDEWELYDDKVPVGELKEGDLFGYNGYTFRVAPAYMFEYIATKFPNDKNTVAVWHDTGSRGRFCCFGNEQLVSKING